PPGSALLDRLRRMSATGIDPRQVPTARKKSFHHGAGKRRDQVHDRHPSRSPIRRSRPPGGTARSTLIYWRRGGMVRSRARKRGPHSVLSGSHRDDDLAVKRPRAAERVGFEEPMGLGGLGERKGPPDDRPEPAGGRPAVDVLGRSTLFVGRRVE